MTSKTNWMLLEFKLQLIYFSQGKELEYISSKHYSTLFENVQWELF